MCKSVTSDGCLFNPCLKISSALSSSPARMQACIFICASLHTICVQLGTQMSDSSMLEDLFSLVQFTCTYARIHLYMCKFAYYMCGMHVCIYICASVHAICVQLGTQVLIHPCVKISSALSSSPASMHAFMYLRLWNLVHRYWLIML